MNSKIIMIGMIIACSLVACSRNGSKASSVEADFLRGKSYSTKSIPLELNIPDITLRCDYSLVRDDIQMSLLTGRASRQSERWGIGMSSNNEIPGSYVIDYIISVERLWDGLDISKHLSTTDRYICIDADDDNRVVKAFQSVSTGDVYLFYYAMNP